MSKSSTTGFLLGALAGGVVGGLAALLYAPKPGAELRADIKEKTDEYIDTAKTSIDETLTALKSRTDVLLLDANNLLSSVTEDTGNVINSSKDAIVSQIMRIKKSIEAMVDTYSTIGTEQLVEEVVSHKVPRKLKKKLKTTDDIEEQRMMAEDLLDKMNT